MNGRFSPRAVHQLPRVSFIGTYLRSQRSSVKAILCTTAFAVDPNPFPPKKSSTSGLRSESFRQTYLSPPQRTSFTISSLYSFEILKHQETRKDWTCIRQGHSFLHNTPYSKHKPLLAGSPEWSSGVPKLWYDHTRHNTFWVNKRRWEDDAHAPFFSRVMSYW